MNNTYVGLLALLASGSSLASPMVSADIKRIVSLAPHTTELATQQDLVISWWR
ncbi:hypothetical protein JCM19239_3052 [Vibrio variabilis]|uniref:Uncharacterized protein n=1 Tax=Vibrio variabilis TaxID=990271 RepID=A0ABQ0J5M8_9VIBR|nr:hypothetical protein JCM19239_3052 [Vibrio variabilis]